MNPDENKIVPQQVTGNESGASETYEGASAEEAKRVFERAKSRLKHINEWHAWSGTGSATFSLTDEAGHVLQQMPAVGNLIRIDIPGPGTIQGEGYDWVRIEEIMEENNGDDELFGILVRPVQAPGSTDKASAHFYTEAATSSFIVKRNGKKVTAAEVGRNEILNTETENLADKMRNIVVGAGAQAGIAYIQWKNLVAGILKD